MVLLVHPILLATLPNQTTTVVPSCRPRARLHVNMQAKPRPRGAQKASLRELELNVPPEASWHREFRGSAYIYVGGLHYGLTEGDVLAVFAQYGEIVDVNLVRDKETGKSKGFAFLAYEDQRSTDLAVDNLDNTTVAGRKVRVDHVREYERREEPKDEPTPLLEPESHMMALGHVERAKELPEQATRAGPNPWEGGLFSLMMEEKEGGTKQRNDGRRKREHGMHDEPGKDGNRRRHSDRHYDYDRNDRKDDRHYHDIRSNQRRRYSRDTYAEDKHYSSHRHRSRSPRRDDHERDFHHRSKREFSSPRYR
mmetsp:Transcript_10860/g.67033  ORF Transcript_10860/g.67033 Transcript_10860/m.67033 type:complete len:309 (-) Transcript_10860:1962-2888(-)